MVSISWSNLIMSILIIYALTYLGIKFLRYILKNSSKF